jgi:hypothetical protein
MSKLGFGMKDYLRDPIHRVPGAQRQTLHPCGLLCFFYAPKAMSKLGFGA